MKDFKNSTKTQYMKGGSCDGYAKGGSVKGAAKISKVMGEFKRGELHSGSKKGPEVTNPKQATAIALSEARKSGAKIPQPVQKKSLGGVLKAISPVAALASSDVGQKIMGSGALGLGGLALNALLKKKQAGTITPAEDKQLAAQQAAAPQTAMKTGGAVKKNTGGMMRKESTSARPVGKDGKPISNEMLNTPERIQRQSGQADPYEPTPKTGPAPQKRKPLGRGAAHDIPLVGPYAGKRTGGLAVMPRAKGGKC